jgi:predicted hydrocarbon binding protein
MEHDLPEKAESILRRWLPALLEGLDRITDEEQRVKTLEFCGRGCGEDDVEEARRIKEQARDKEHLLQLINERIKFCGEWEWVDGKIHTVCAECGCPLVVEGYVQRCPTFCLCSRGWVKAIFGEALGQEVDVELVQAIGRGDECCEFVIKPRPGGSHHG